MITTPKELLFREEFRLITGKMDVLFKNSSQLAKEISSVKDSHYYGKMNTVKGLLSQSFRKHTHQHSRSLPEKLKKEIYILVQSKLSNEEYVISSFEERFERGMFELKHKEVVKQMVASSNIRSLFQEASENAKSHLIVTMQPAETRSNDKAEELVQDMLSRLIEKEGYEYRFFLPSTAIADEFWTKLEREIPTLTNIYSEMLSNGSKSEMEREEIAGWVNKIKKPSDFLSTSVERLKVYIVDMKYCVFPYVIFDYDNSDLIKGFSVYHEGDRGETIAIIPDKSLEKWREVICSELQGENNKREYSYQHYLKAKL